MSVIDPRTLNFIKLLINIIPIFNSLWQSKTSVYRDTLNASLMSFLRCGRLEYGFLRAVCDDCKHEKLVAFSCKRRRFCPSCGSRRMVESAALLADDVLGGYPIRQWVLSLPIPLYLLLARYLCELGKVMSIVHREISTYVIQRADFANKHAQKSAGWAVPLDRFCSEASHTSLFHLIKPLIFIFSSATR